MSQESTLTAPCDRDRSVPFTLSKNAPPLTDEETALAKTELNKPEYVKRFPTIERRFVDPPLSNQKICLISFVPARGAQPNNEGIYGFAKVRGSFANEAESDEYAEQIIRNQDSYHAIYHAYVGRPFPLTTSSDFSESVRQIDLKKEMTNAYNDDVKKKRDKEEKDIEDIKQRERNLLEDVKREEPDDDHYTVLRVKKAQLMWTYLETEKKMESMAGLIAKARKEIEELDALHPEFKETYMGKYMEARRQAGIQQNKEQDDKSFIRYLVEDAKIQAVDAEYERLYGSASSASSSS